MKLIYKVLLPLAAIDAFIALLAIYELTTRELSSPSIRSAQRFIELAKDIKTLPPERAIPLLTEDLRAVQLLAVVSAKIVDGVAWITLVLAVLNAVVLIWIFSKRG